MIYIYLYYYKKNNQYGKYSNKFKILFKKKIIKSKKLTFRKKCKKYDIDKNN